MRTIGQRTLMRPPRRLAFVLFATIAALLTLTGAGAQSGPVTVVISAGLSPQSITIAPGTTVTWRNDDRLEHRVRASSGPVQFDSGDMKRGETFTRTFTVQGTFDYHDDRDRTDRSYWGVVVVTSSPPPLPGPGGGGGGGGTTPPPSSASVQIIDFGYSPATLVVAVGGTVTWTNTGDARHTVSATDRSFDSGQLDTGGAFSRAFATAGSFNYFCDLHPSMTASVSVAEPGKPLPPPAPPPPAPVPPPGADSPPPPGSVSIVDYSYTPAALVVAPGSTVNFVNNGVALHTVTASDSSYDSGFLRSGQAWTRTYAEAGTYAYFCAIHPTMTGSVIVAEPGTTPPIPPDLPPGLPGGATPPPAAAPGEVQVIDYDFVPGTLSVTPGATVTWRFSGIAPHTVTATDASFDSGILNNGASYSRTFATPGTFPYLCAIHPNMQGEVLVAAAGSVAPPPVTVSTAQPPPPGRGDVGMLDFSFAPSTITLAVGGIVTWANRGVAPHTVTARDGSFDSGTVTPGGVFTQRFATAGTYGYVCILHPNMTGTVVVRAPDGSAPPTTTVRTEPPPAPSTTEPVQLDREMIDFDYAPQSVTVAAGSTLTWTNTGVAPHTVTSPDGLFDSGTKEKGEAWSYTFERPGTFAYYCIFHENMVGTVVVVGEATGDAQSSAGPVGEVARPTASSGGGGSGTGIWIAALAVTIGAVAITFAAGGIAVLARASRTGSEEER